MPPPSKPDKVLKYRDLRSRLGRFGVTELPSRGKGSHRMFIKVLEGRPVIDVVRCHSEGDELSRKIVGHVREKFQIPFDEFYS